LDYIKPTVERENFLPIVEHISEVLSPEMVQNQLQVMERAIATKQLQVYEHQLFKHDRLTHEEVRILAINDQEVLVIVRDISDRKQIEQELTESRQFLQTVVDTFPLSVFWKDRQSVYLGCNQNFARDANLSSTSEILGKNDYDLPWGAKEAAFYQADDRQVIESGVAKLAIQETITLGTGENRWIETNKIPLRDLNDNVIGVVGTFQDISDRKQAEDNLKTERLRLQLALDAAKMGAWSRSSESNQLIWSDRVQEIFGFVPGTFSGDPEIFLAMIYPEDRDRVVQALAHTFATGEPYHLEYRIFRLDGEMRWIAVWAILTERLSTDERQLIGVIADISDRKQAEQSLQEKNTELEKLVQLREETLELREDMSNMIVHDLRTPLTTITLAAGLINQYGDRAGQRALIVRKAGQILDSAKQLEKMIDSLLFMAKLESGKILFNPIPTDLHYLGAEVIANFELIANARNIELRSEFPILGQTTLIDATILRRILDNLMSNALKFSPVGGQVTLSLEYLPENRFRVKVADTGTGIGETERQKIFQKFEIGSLKRNVSQTGLGLAFCKMAVEAQGGTLAIADNHPQGVIFIVEI
jgi:PAS domain S-box-containing protein